MKHTLAMLVTLLLAFWSPSGMADGQRYAYLVSDLRIPFWDIMWRGVQSQAERQQDKVRVLSAGNSARKELENMVQVIRDQVDGIVLSPTNSSAAVTLLKLAGEAGIPVVIADIGTQGGEYVSYIESDNKAGAYQLGKLLASEFKARELDGTVGIIAIPQQRLNGRLRTEGFIKALNEASIRTANIFQQRTFSYRETFNFSQQLIREHLDLQAIWLQGSDRYQGALDAIRDAGKEGEILLICFDAEPEFIGMIRDGTLVGAGMQQPFLMGQQAVITLKRHLQGNKVVKTQQLEVLAVSRDNLKKLLPTIQRNVLGRNISAH